MDNKRTVIVIQRELYHYRCALYEELGKEFDLQVIHTNVYDGVIQNFEAVQVSHFRFLGMIAHFYLPPILDKKITIIVECNVRLLLLWLLLFVNFLDRRRNFIYWGNQLSSSSISSSIRKWIASGRIKSLFYSEKNAQELTQEFFDKDYHFWYNNTVKVKERKRSTKKNTKTFLHIGGCQERKKHEVVLHSIAKLKDQHPDVRYVIVGNKDNEDYLKAEAAKVGISDALIVHGYVHNEDGVAALYDEALASICYGQAGLTVLQSLGNATPVIVGVDAISGGESDAIINGYNGLRVDGVNQLTQAMLTLISSQSYSYGLSNNALESYWESHSFDSMVNKFKEVIGANTH